MRRIAQGQLLSHRCTAQPFATCRHGLFFFTGRGHTQGQGAAKLQPHQLCQKLGCVLHPQHDLQMRCVAAYSHQRKRNPFVDIERDVLPDGKPNTPWRRLKLRIQQALSIQALIKIYINNHHKTNVWRPIHSAGILMRIGALQYYRVLQTPVTDEQTSANILELLHLLAPDLTQPRVLHVLDAARLCQVIVVLSTLNPPPPDNLIDPLVRELMRDGSKKLPMTKPDLLAELASGLVRLGWWEKDVWLAVVAAAKSALLAQQQVWQQQEQQQQQQERHLLVAAESKIHVTSSAEQHQQQQGDLQRQPSQLQLKAADRRHPQQQQHPWQQKQENPQSLQQQQQEELLWQDEDDYVRWEQQQWEQFQQQQQQHQHQQQQQLGVTQHFSWQQQQDQQQQWVEDPQLWEEAEEYWQQEQEGFAAQTEFQWEEQLQTEDQQQWLTDQQWYEPDWQQLADEDDVWLEEPWQQQQPHGGDQQQQQQQQQQQRGVLEDETPAEQPTSGSRRNDLFGPRWLSADFPKLAAAVAAVAARQDHRSSTKSSAQISSSSMRSGMTLRDSIEDVMQPLGSAAVRFLVLLTPAELADLAEAYAVMSLRHNELLPGISKALIDKVNYLTSSFSSHSPLWQQQQQWQGHLADGNSQATAGEAAAESDVAAVIRAAHALCELGYADLGLVEAVQKLVLHSTRTSSNSGANGSNLDAAAGIRAVQLVQLLQLLVGTGSSSSASVVALATSVCTAVASSGLDALSPQQLKAAAAALVELKQHPDAAAAAAVIGAAAAARAGDCGPEVLCGVLWGSVMLGCHDELLAELAVAAAEHTAELLLEEQQKQKTKKSRSKGSRRHTVGSVNASRGEAIGGQGSAGGVLSAKSQAQLVWALQQVNRHDLIDRALVAVHPLGTSVQGTASPLEAGVPVF